MPMTKPRVAIIKRDGQEIDRVESTEAAIISWFMKNTNQSTAYALKYDGYSVTDEDGQSLIPADYLRGYSAS